VVALGEDDELPEDPLPDEPLPEEPLPEPLPDEPPPEVDAGVTKPVIAVTG
jgi:hypothetical protein